MAMFPSIFETSVFTAQDTICLAAIIMRDRWYIPRGKYGGRLLPSRIENRFRADAVEASEIEYWRVNWRLPVVGYRKGWNLLQNSILALPNIIHRLWHDAEKKAYKKHYSHNRHALPWVEVDNVRVIKRPSIVKIEKEEWGPGLDPIGTHWIFILQVITIRSLVTTMKTARCCQMFLVVYIYLSVGPCCLWEVYFYREKIHPIAESKAPYCGSRASSYQWSVIAIIDKYDQ